MLVVSDALHEPSPPRGLVATIGNYDGIHRGQQSVLDLVKGRALETGLKAAVITFDPHPRSVLMPDRPVDLLTTKEEKEALLDKAGMDVVAIVRFTPELSRTPARTFVRDFLHRRLDVREVYVGSNFVFGHNRGGDLSLLRQMGDSFGFSAFAVDEVVHDGEVVSSTRIRAALRAGEVMAAEALLGRPYSIRGLVARGEGVGRKLGFRTANLVRDNTLLPENGVYACRMSVSSGEGSYDAVANIGTRPTLYEESRRIVEAHLLDFDRDIYGERAELQFLERLREERAFPTIIDLAEQIGRDVDLARECLRKHPEPSVRSSI
jgi:riboflavin kinase/FMN adenylyltransferase